ncbi:MAG: PqqD family peptide modification chaperone [Anaerolineae bacterium]|nr:PqqD family peptide modification chaperone [Anaerolineae bacterium]
MSLLDKVKSWFTHLRPLPPQMLHYQTPPEAEQQYRLHLRIEKDGRGLLIINAATVLHLNQTAAEYVRLLIQGADAEEAARAIARRYRVPRATARADYERLREQILTLATTQDLCPVTYLGMERAEPFSAESSAPYRVDLALTYRTDEAGTLSPGTGKRVERELTTGEWQRVITTLWNVGVPHICFTGGEPTLRDDLAELIRYAEGLGQVTGLLTDGRRLRQQAYLDELLLAGLDHLQITLTSHQPALHDAIVGRAGAWEEAAAGLRNALAADIYVTVPLVVLPANADSVTETVAYLAGLGVPAIALSSPLRTAPAEEQQALQQALEAAREAVHRHHLTLVWDLAAPYSHINPVEVEAGFPADQVIRQHLYVEPDGDVLPTQGYNLVLGNLLRDPWEAIWDNPARRKLEGSVVNA